MLDGRVLRGIRMSEERIFDLLQQVLLNAEDMERALTDEEEAYAQIEKEKWLHREVGAELVTLAERRARLGLNLFQTLPGDKPAFIEEESDG